jgi:4-carboxymuconolactone decarboxylase
MTGKDRLPPIAVEKMTAAQKAAADEFQAGRGYGVLGPFAVMLRSPEVMLRAKAMGDYLRFRNVLPKHVSEMVILRSRCSASRASSISPASTATTASSP